MVKIVKESLSENLNDLKKSEYDELDDFIIDLSQELPSALDVYLPEKERIKLYNLVKQGYKVKTMIWDDDHRYDSERFEEIYIDRWISKGWKLFWKEDNMDQIEWILVKPS